MLCQNCGKNEATTHIKQVINGDTAERHLCSDCAEHLGYGDAFSGFGFDVAGLFGNFFGSSFIFSSAEPVSEEEAKTDEREELKKQMDEAVAAQNFELAAQLRDRIKELEGGAENE